MTSSVYTAAATDADPAAAVNQAMTLALAAASHAHPDGYTVTAVSHDARLLTTPRSVEPNFYQAAAGAGTTTVHDQVLLVTAVIVVEAHPATTGP